MTAVLATAVSPETAHVSFAYPFGGTRCLKRDWIETGTKGAGKNQQRHVSQTTHKSFNYAYTDRIEKDGLEAANAWAEEQLKTGRVLWNKEKAGVYHLMIVIFLQDLGDGTGRLGVENDAIGHYVGPEKLDAFKKRYTGLNEEQTERLAMIEKAARKVNAKEWAEFDAKAA